MPSNVNLELNYFFAQGQVQVEEEYRVFDEASFLAEVGGCLGLTLGASLLTVFDLAQKTWKNLIKF